MRVVSAIAELVVIYLLLYSFRVQFRYLDGFQKLKIRFYPFTAPVLTKLGKITTTRACNGDVFVMSTVV